MRAMIHLTVLLALATPSIASAQPPAEVEDTGSVVMPEARYDYDRGAQFLWSSVGGVAGITILGGGSALGLLAFCAGGQRDCSLLAPMGVFLGGGIGLFGGAMIGAHLSGGEREGGATVLGSGLGALVGLFTAGAVIGSLPALNEGRLNLPLSAALFLGLAGVGGGLGAALGYQLTYPEAPFQQVSVAPMLMDGAGVMVQGSF